MGPRDPEPLEVAEELVFLCHAPCMTLSGERLTEPFKGLFYPVVGDRC
jgi:hypothetical protein